MHTWYGGCTPHIHAMCNVGCGGHSITDGQFGGVGGDPQRLGWFGGGGDIIQLQDKIPGASCRFLPLPKVMVVALTHIETAHAEEQATHLCQLLV